MVMDYRYESFWTRPKMREEDTPLTIWHLLLPFIFLSVALVIYMMTFYIEKNGRKIGLKLWAWFRYKVTMGTEVIGALVRRVTIVSCGVNETK